MKKIFLLLFLLINGKEVFSQEATTGLQGQLNQYFQANQDKDWDTVLGLVNPKLFEFAPKDMLKLMYTQMDRDAGMQFHYSDYQILDLKEGLWMADTSYIPVDYSTILRIRINPQLFKNPDDLLVLRQGFEKTFQGQEVVYDAANSQFFIGIKSTLIASSARNSGKWYFSEYKANDPIFQKILPTEVSLRLHRGWNE